MWPGQSQVILRGTTVERIVVASLDRSGSTAGLVVVAVSPVYTAVAFTSAKSSSFECAAR